MNMSRWHWSEPEDIQELNDKNTGKRVKKWEQLPLFSDDDSPITIIETQEKDGPEKSV